MISKKPLCDGADNIIKRIGIQTGPAHKSAIETITLGLEKNTDRIVDAQTDSTKDLTAEIRALRGQFAEEV